MSTTIAAPTAKQIAFATKLYAERVSAEDVDNFAAILVCRDRRWVSSKIDQLLSLPAPLRVVCENRLPAATADTAVRPPVTEQGMYRNARGEVFKVQIGRESGKPFAKKLVVFEHGQAEVSYAPGAVRHLSSEDKMTLEDAKAFGHQFGVCCCCGATLTDPKSVAAGIGPVCAKRV